LEGIVDYDSLTLGSSSDSSGETGKLTLAIDPELWTEVTLIAKEIKSLYSNEQCSVTEPDNIQSITKYYGISHH
jgi:hypothetical protein